MSFTYSVIGDNSPENREHLEKIGWKVKYIQEDADTIVCASNTGMFSGIEKDTQSWFKEYQSECINCIGNPALFRAVTAMRDDSDKDQFFVHEDGLFVFCDQSELKHVTDNKDEYQDYAVSEFHKATLEELINHFNSK